MQVWMRIYLLRSVKSHKRVAKNEKIEVQFWMAVGCRYIHICTKTIIRPFDG